MSNINITVTEQDPINVSIASPEVQNVDVTGQSISATVSDGDKGDIVVTGNGTVWTLDPNALATRVPYTGATSDVNLGEFGIQLGNLEFDTTPTNAPTGAGSMVWNDTEGTVDLVLKGGNLVLPLGQKQTIRAVNGTGGNLTRVQYRAVKITGAQGQRLQISLARADDDANSKDTIGIVGEDISNNQTGFIVSSGLIEEINTTGSLQGETWTDGDTLYLSGTTFGVITNVKPAAPIHTVILGFVVYAHANHGKIYVKVDNGYELDELHNCNVSTAASGDYLRYNGTTWVDATISAADLPSAIDASKIGSGLVSNTEFGYLDGVTSAIQTQINARLPVTLGTVATGEYIRYNGTAWVDAFIQAGDLPSAIDAAKIANGTVSNTEFQYLDGVTSAIQTQLNGKQATLTNPVTGTGANNIVPRWTSASTIGTSIMTLTATEMSISASSIYGITNTITNTNSNSYLTINVYGTDAFGITPWKNSAVIESVPQSTGGLVLSSFSNSIIFQTSSRTTRATLTAAGRLLLGTTTESTYLLDVAGDIRNTTSAYFATASGNVGIGTTTFGTSAARVIGIINGTAPSTSPTDVVQIYANDITAGNAALHIRTEGGAVVKLYQQTTGVGAATFVANSGTAVNDASTFGGYTLKQIVQALQNAGFLA